MRPTRVLILSLVCLLSPLGWSFGAVHATQMPEEPAGVLLSIDTADLRAETSAVRWIVLPPDAEGLDVSLLTPGANDRLILRAGPPMVSRGVRMAPVWIEAKESLDTKALPAHVEIHVTPETPTSGRASDPVPQRGFFGSWPDLITPSTSKVLDTQDVGSYLIICAPMFQEEVEPLRAWKHEEGYPTLLVTTNETGATNDEIRDYIANLYETSPNPPRYVLLVGDVDRVPAYDYHSSVSDHPYSLVDGDDWMPDLDVGRLSVSSEAELETVVAKILRHEQDPYREDDSWFSRGLVVAGDYGSTTPVPVSRWCRELLLGIGYTQVDSVYFPPVWSRNDPRNIIDDAVNDGVSIVSYRGWAYGIHGWEPPHFTSEEVFALTNGWKLPVVFSFVCQNNDFAHDEVCFGEAWIRAGSATEPKGAVAFIGNSEPWSHTRFNDAAAMGAFKAIGERGVRRLGTVLTACKLEVLSQFPGEIPYDLYTDNSVEFYFYIYSLLGDPEMEIWTAPPRDVTVDHAAEIPRGANFLDVSVMEADGTTPVVGAHVGVTQGPDLLGSGWTDAEGMARISASFEETDTPVRVTVTGAGVFPYRGDATVVEAEASLAYTSMTLDDDAVGGSLGNGDGIANPGETLELMVTLRNMGTSAAEGIQAELAPAAGVEILQGSVTYPDIAAGGQGDPDGAFVIRLDPTAEDQRRLSLRLTATSATLESETRFPLVVQAPDLRYESHTVDGQGVLLPGEESSLSVSVTNDGSAAASSVDAVLRTSSPLLVTVADSSTTFGPVAAGETATSQSDPRVQVNPEAAVGQAAVFTLDMTTAEGYVSQTSFSVIIGNVDHRAPLGPDAYGYFVYDNSDTDYPATSPVYDWTPISPRFGGEGTILSPLRDNLLSRVELPFPFTYYGKEYNDLTISDNGWVSFETDDYYDYYNWKMPDSYGNGAQIAVFWDNLDPRAPENDSLGVDGIYTFYDQENHRFIVEWSRLPNARPELDDVQTFQLILLDPAQIDTPTGDGIFQCMYKDVVNDDIYRMFATVGMEDETETKGLQYTYCNFYPAEASPLSAGLALQFSTVPPRYDPFHLTDFTATPSDNGVHLSWTPCDGRCMTGFRVYRGLSKDDLSLLTPEVLDPGTRVFHDASADRESTYDYWVGALDAVGHESILGPFAYDGLEAWAAAQGLSLAMAGANPVRDEAQLRFIVPRRERIGLRVYDLSGRLVRTLARGTHEPGAWTVSWDGRDDRGDRVASGLYLLKLSGERESRNLRILYVK